MVLLLLRHHFRIISQRSEDYQRFTHEGLKNLFISQNTNLDIYSINRYDLTIRRENRLVETNKDFLVIGEKIGGHI